MDDTPVPGEPEQAPDRTDGNGRPPEPADDLRRRLSEAEQELARVRAERDEYKASTYSLLGQLFPFVPPTPEEVHDMLYGPRGQPILEIIEEYERKLAGGDDAGQ